MEVRCDKCQARYRVDDARIGPQGLTMRCGKCQNTFKVTKPAPVPTLQDQSPVAPAPKPAAAAVPLKPRPLEPSGNATMVFGQSPPAPSRPAMPTERPGAGAKPAARPAAAPAEEGAGRTMMFQTGNLKTPGASRPAAKVEPQSGATMVFGQSPSARPAPAKPAPALKPATKADSAGARMTFGVSPAVARAATPAKTVPAPVAAPGPSAKPAPRAEAAWHGEHADDSGSEAAAQEEAAPQDEAGANDSGVDAEGAEETAEAPPPRGAFDKAPPKGLLIGVGAGLAALLIAGVALVGWKKLGRHPAPPAAVETLTSAQAEADQDTLASLAAAEGKARDAIDVAGPKSAFPQAGATLARIEIQWADALNDQAAVLTAKGGDSADAKAAELQTQAKAKLKAAFDALSAAIKADAKSPDLQVALADYYRAQRSGSNMNKALKSAQALKADDARVAQVQGMALAQEDDGAEKAIPKLKAALEGNPQSARLHFRLALAYLALKDEANAAAELKATLKLSPQHERAKMAMETAASADGK